MLCRVCGLLTSLGAGVSSPPLPIPQQLTNLIRWYDSAYAENITQRTGAFTGVTALVDRNADAGDMFGYHEQREPVYQLAELNSLNTMGFDGSNDSLRYPSMGLNGKQNVSIMWLAKIDTTTSGSDAMLAFGDGAQGRIEYNKGLAQLSAEGNLGILPNATLLFKDDANMSDKWAIYSIITDGTEVKTYVNGVLNQTLPQAGAWVTNDASDYAIMGTDSPNRWLKGGFAEMTPYDAALSEEDRIKLHNYYSTKWGVGVTIDPPVEGYVAGAGDQFGNGGDTTPPPESAFSSAFSSAFGNN